MNSHPLYPHANSEDAASFLLQDLKQHFIPLLTRQLGLSFEESNTHVCMANHMDVLPAYRTAFNLQHVLDYGMGISALPFNEIANPYDPKSESLPWPLPSTSEQFWEAVDKGSRKRRQAMSK